MFIFDSPYKNENSLEILKVKFDIPDSMLNKFDSKRVTDVSDLYQNSVYFLDKKEVNFEDIANNLKNFDSIFLKELITVLGLSPEMSKSDVFQNTLFIEKNDSINQVVLSNIGVFEEIPRRAIFINKIYIFNDSSVLVNYFSFNLLSCYTFNKNKCIIINFDKKFNSYKIVYTKESYHR